MQAHQLVNQSSGDVEIYTPPQILALARELLGAIDLDPASSERANVNVQATHFFREPLFVVDGLNGRLPVRRYASWGGLEHQWHGRVWMNPPFILPDSACGPDCTKKRCEKRGWHTAADMPGTPDWVNKFCDDYASGFIIEGLCITFASTSERWFQPLLKRPQCFPSSRTNYFLPDGTKYTGVTKGSAISYFGPRPTRFAEVFRSLGVVKAELS